MKPGAADSGVTRPRASLAPAVLDSLPELIALVDRQGTIRAVNRAWREMAPAIDGRELLRGRVAVGANYLEVCARAAAAGDETAAAARRGIEQVLAGELPHFQLEYLSQEPGRPAWYLLSVTPVAGGPAGQGGVVVAHADVTARRLAEEEQTIVQELLAVQGSPADIGGYYRPDEAKASAVMTPSRTLNGIVADLRG